MNGMTDDPVEQYLKLRAAHEASTATRPAPDASTGPDPVSEYLKLKAAASTPPLSMGDKVAGYLQAPLRGLAPFADDATAGVGAVMDVANAALHGRPTPNVRDAYHAWRQRIDRDAQGIDPNARAALEATGNVAAMAIPVARVAAAGPALTAARAVARPAMAAAEPSAVGVMQKVLGVGKQAATAGATSGAVASLYGLGEQDGTVEDRLRNALHAGAAGTALGAGLALGGGAATAVGALARAAAEKRTQPRFTRTEGRALKFLGEDLSAGDKPAGVLLNAYESGDVAQGTPLLESGGGKVRDLARDVRVLGGPGSQRVEREVTGMRQGQSKRVGTELRAAFGVDEARNSVDFAEQLARERAEAGSPLFEQANREAGAITDPRFPELIKTPWGKKAWTEAQMLLAQDEHPLPKAVRAVQTPHTIQLPDGRTRTGVSSDVEAVPVPDLRAMHYFRMAIDNMLEHPNAYRVKLGDGNVSGTAETVQSQLQRMRGEVTGMLHRASDTFRQADATWADRSDLMRAYSAGQRFPTVSADEVQSVVRQMPEASRDLYRLGNLTSLEQVLGDVRDNRDALGRVWETPAVREKYEAVLPPERWQRLQQNLERETARRDIARTVLDGPNTADKLRGTERLMSADLGAGNAVPSVVRSVTSPVKAVQGIAERVGQGYRNRQVRQTGALLADHLLTDDPTSVLRAILAYQHRPQAGAMWTLPDNSALTALARALGRRAGVIDRDQQ